MKNTAFLLALAFLPLAAPAQTPAADSLKGRIWTATAERIWADTKPRAPQPPAWPTNAAFNEWLGTQGKGEKSGIGLLRGDVVRTLGAGQPATPTQVAQAIVAEAASPPRSREWLQKLDVPALRKALQGLVPLGAGPAGAAPVLGSSGDSLGTPLPPAGATITDNSSFFGQHPWLAALLGALAGAGLAAAALRNMRRRRRHHAPAAYTSAAATSTPALSESAEVLRLQNEVQRLVHYIKELEAKLLHYENANPADAALTPDAEPTLAPPVPPAELPHPPSELK